MRAKRQAEELQRELEGAQQQLAAARRQIAELEAKSAERAERDPLTGLHSAVAFATRLSGELERSRRHGRRLSVAVVDVDGFHLVNASHGRAAGDEVLKAVAATLKHTRASDLVCRSSADEFLVLLPETTAPDAAQVFERLLAELESKRVGALEGISVSVGLAEWERGMSGDAFVLAAVDRMQGARAAGGGRVAGGNREVDRSDAVPEPLHDAIAGLAEALTERDRYTGEH